MMTDAQSKAHLRAAHARVKQRQDAFIKQYSPQQFNYEALFDDGLLEFKDAAGAVRLKATCFRFASYSDKSNTWQWGWANPSVPTWQQDKAIQIRQLYDITGRTEFLAGSPLSIPIDEAMDLAALAIDHLDVLAYYRVPCDDLHVLLAVTDVA